MGPYLSPFHSPCSSPFFSPFFPSSQILCFSTFCMPVNFLSPIIASYPLMFSHYQPQTFSFWFILTTVHPHGSFVTYCLVRIYKRRRFGSITLFFFFFGHKSKVRFTSCCGQVVQLCFCGSQCLKHDSFGNKGQGKTVSFKDIWVDQLWVNGLGQKRMRLQGKCREKMRHVSILVLGFDAFCFKYSRTMKIPLSPVGTLLPVYSLLSSHLPSYYSPLNSEDVVSV